MEKKKKQFLVRIKKDNPTTQFFGILKVACSV